MCHLMTRTTRPIQLLGAVALLLGIVSCGSSDDGVVTETLAEAAAAQSGAEATAPDPVVVANGDYLGSYTLVDETFGTQVMVTVDGGTRIITSNTLPNHETGDFPNSGNPNAIAAQDKTWTLTTEPAFTGQAQVVREPGVALNGVKFEPGTAESVPCSTGESYRIEGLQDMFDLGMDFNNAHVQPTGEYHYHGVSDLLVDAFASDEDLVLARFRSRWTSDLLLQVERVHTELCIGDRCPYRHRLHLSRRRNRSRRHHPRRNLCLRLGVHRMVRATSTNATARWSVMRTPT